MVFILVNIGLKSFIGSTISTSVALISLFLSAVFAIIFLIIGLSSEKWLRLLLSA